MESKRFFLRGSFVYFDLRNLFKDLLVVSYTFTFTGGGGYFFFWCPMIFLVGTFNCKISL